MFLASNWWVFMLAGAVAIVVAVVSQAARVRKASSRVFAAQQKFMEAPGLSGFDEFGKAAGSILPHPAIATFAMLGIGSFLAGAIGLIIYLVKG